MTDIKPLDWDVAPVIPARATRNSWLIVNNSGDIIRSINCTAHNANLNCPSGCTLIKNTENIDARKYYFVGDEITERKTFDAMPTTAIVGQVLEIELPVRTRVVVSQKGKKSDRFSIEEGDTTLRLNVIDELPFLVIATHPHYIAAEVAINA